MGTDMSMRSMALNTERGMLMTHKLFQRLLISLTETGIADINMQQMPSYSGENHTAQLRLEAKREVCLARN